MKNAYDELNQAAKLEIDLIQAEMKSALKDEIENLYSAFLHNVLTSAETLIAMRSVVSVAKNALCNVYDIAEIESFQIGLMKAMIGCFRIDDIEDRDDPIVYMANHTHAYSVKSALQCEIDRSFDEFARGEIDSNELKMARDILIAVAKETLEPTDVNEVTEYIQKRR